jgi:hypothetical protein
MAWTTSCNTFLWFFLLFFGLLIVAALGTHANRRSATDVLERGVDHRPARPVRTAFRVASRLTELRPGGGRTGVRESDIPDLEECAQRFEEAIERIRLRRQGLRNGGTGEIGFKPPLQPDS